MSHCDQLLNRREAKKRSCSWLHNSLECFHFRATASGFPTDLMTLRNSLHNSSCFWIPLCGSDFITRDPPGSSQLQLILALPQCHSGHFYPMWGSVPRHDMLQTLWSNSLLSNTALENKNNNYWRHFCLFPTLGACYLAQTARMCVLLLVQIKNPLAWICSTRCEDFILSWGHLHTEAK